MAGSVNPNIEVNKMILETDTGQTVTGDGSGFVGSGDTTFQAGGVNRLKGAPIYIWATSGDVYFYNNSGGTVNAQLGSTTGHFNLKVGDFQTNGTSRIAQNGNATLATTTVSGELKGSRMIIPFGYNGTMTVGNLATVGFKGVDGVQWNNTTQSNVMPRAGSVVGISISYTNGTVTNWAALKVAKNTGVGPLIIITQAISTAAASTNYSTYATYARGTYTFYAGDKIDVEVYNSTASATMLNVTGLLEVQFDT